MFVLKDFVPDSFVAQICANFGAHAHFGAYPRGRSIVVGVTGFKLTISMCSLIR